MMMLPRPLLLLLSRSARAESPVPIEQARGKYSRDDTARCCYALPSFLPRTTRVHTFRSQIARRGIRRRHPRCDSIGRQQGLQLRRPNALLGEQSQDSAGAPATSCPTAEWASGRPSRHQSLSFQCVATFASFSGGKKSGSKRTRLSVILRYSRNSNPRISLEYRIQLFLQNITVWKHALLLFFYSFEGSRRGTAGGTSGYLNGHLRVPQRESCLRKIAPICSILRSHA